MHLFNSSNGMPVVVQTGLRGCGPETGVRSPPTSPSTAGGTPPGTVGVTQWLRASVLNCSWICGFLGSGKACWEKVMCVEGREAAAWMRKWLRLLPAFFLNRFPKGIHALALRVRADLSPDFQQATGLF